MHSRIIIALIIIVISGCSSSGDFSKRVGSSEEHPYTIYVLNEGWHTGIVMKVSDISEDDFPEVKTFSGDQFIDIGWGDEEYYRIPGFDLSLAMRALLSPSSSALKIRTLNIPVETYYKTFTYCVAFHLSKEEFTSLSRYVGNTFKMNSNKTIMLENRSNIIYFYKANGDYHLFNTCNTWVAEALEYTGIPVSVSMVVSGSDLFFAIKDYGKVLVNK
jgi:uncharacterized protein (TIGR02117 family)